MKPRTEQIQKWMRMKAAFESKDPVEIKRMSKADDMANFIFELVHNGWREFEETDYDYSVAWGKINTLLQEHNIDIDDLV